MKPRPRRKSYLDGLTIEEFCRQLYCSRRPEPSLTEEERKRRAARVGANIIARGGTTEEAARTEEWLSRMPDPEEEFNKMVKLLLQFELGENESTTEEDREKFYRSQSHKLHQRWSFVVAGRKKWGLSWKQAYEFASDLSNLGKDSPWAGSPRTMKAAYQHVERTRRAQQTDQRSEKESKCQCSKAKNFIAVGRL